MSREVRRADKLMPEHAVQALLQSGDCARVGTVDADGWPCVCPPLYVWREGRVWFHNTAADGHLHANVSLRMPTR